VELSAYTSQGCHLAFLWSPYGIAAAEIRPGKKEEEDRRKKPQDENRMVCPIE